jgi:outer membrane protein assembly factor BamB
MRRATALLAAALLLGAGAPRAQAPVAPGDTWPYWRGPQRTGVALSDAPTEWGDGHNVAWRAEIPGRGHSSPVVWGDRIFLTTAVPTGRTVTPPAGGGGGRPAFGDGGTGAFEEQRFEVLALDRDTGEVAWRRVAATAAPHEGYHSSYGSFASHSPVTDGERLYVSFGSRGLYVYDLDGELLWSRDFAIEMEMFLGFGEGVGPVLHDGRLILLFDHEGASFITMLDAASGRELWRTARAPGTNWAAPLVVNHDGRREIVVAATKKVRSYAFDTGALVWEADGLGQNTIPHPVQHGDLVLVMSGFRNPQLMAIRLGGTGDLTGTDAIVWRASRGLSYTASPVLHDGRLYVVTDAARVSNLDASTGEAAYAQQALPDPHNIKASPVAAGGHLYIATEEGAVVVTSLGDTLEVVASNTLADQSFVSTPAVADGDLYLRSRTHLFRIAEGAGR